MEVWKYIVGSSGFSGVLHVEVQYHVGMGTAGRLVASLAARKTV